MIFYNNSFQVLLLVFRYLPFEFHAFCMNFILLYSCKDWKLPKVILRFSFHLQAMSRTDLTSINSCIKMKLNTVLQQQQ